MAYLAADMVKESSTTTGTGTYNLAGAEAGFRTFVAGYGSGNRATYKAQMGNDWEINEGVVTDATPDTLTRARLLVSSTGSAINWGAGTKILSAVYAAADRNPRTRALTADHAISSTTGTEVTGLELADVQPGIYVFQFFVLVQSATTTVSPLMGVNFTGTATAKILLRYPDAGSSAVGSIGEDLNAINSTGIVAHLTTGVFTTTAPNLGHSGGVTTINTTIIETVEGILIVTAAGNLELWHSSETATSTTVMAGSSVILTRIDD